MPYKIGTNWTIGATLIHGITGKAVETCDLPQSQDTVDEGIANGKRYLLIDGYRYEVAEEDWQALKAVKGE